MTDLNSALLAAHDRGDRAAMVALYRAAADTDDPDRRAFFLTQALVFALEAGHADAAAIRAELVAMGRETPN
ncbi:MAG: hypothetical protein AAFP16_20160 [Pseudomonadota bacterium]